MTTQKTQKITKSRITKWFDLKAAAARNFANFNGRDIMHTMYLLEDNKMRVGIAGYTVLDAAGDRRQLQSDRGQIITIAEDLYQELYALLTK